MPADALPQPWPAPKFGQRHFRHEWSDALGRPMAGKVTFTGKAGAHTDDAAAPPAPVVAAIVDGVIEVDLVPDHYTFAAQLRTVEGHSHVERGEIDLTEQP